MTRFRIVSLFASLLVLATALAACGGGGGGSDEDPKTVLESATLEGVESGNLDVSLGIDAEGNEGGKADITLSGPFQGGGEGQTPQLDMTLKADGNLGGEDIDFEGGLVLLSGKAFVNYEGTNYEVDSFTYNFVESLVKQSQNEGNEESADVTACQEAAEKLDINDFAENLSNDGGVDVDGVSTTKVSGDLNVAGAIDSVIEIAEDPACAQLSGSTPLPTAELKEAKDTVGDAVKSARIEVYVGDDDIIRRVSAQLSIEVSDEGSGGPEGGDLEFDLTLSGVNEDQSISAPERSKPLSDLFLKLGINPIELAGGLGEGGGVGGLLEGLEEATGGAEGVGGLLEGLGEEGGSSGGNRQKYLKCLQGASTPVEIQNCAKLLG